MNFGEKIYSLRTKAGLSQGELADRLDVSRQAVSKWENNSAVPELDKLLKMSELFSVSLDELVKGDIPIRRDEIFENKENIEESISVEMDLPEVQINTRLPVRKIFAFIFFGLTLLIAVLSFCFENIDVITLCIPTAGIGLICWFCKNYTGLNCLWFSYLLFQFYSVFYIGGLNFSVYAIRLLVVDIRYLFTGLAALAAVIFMVAFTAFKVKNKPIKKPQKAKTGLIVRWVLAGLYYIISMAVTPFLTDYALLNSEQGRLFSDLLQVLSFFETIVPIVLFTVAVSFTVRYMKLKKT